jgi:hypothetical protein
MMSNFFDVGPTRCCCDSRFLLAMGIAHAQTSMIKSNEIDPLALTVPMASDGYFIFCKRSVEK